VVSWVVRPPIFAQFFGPPGGSLLVGLNEATGEAYGPHEATADLPKQTDYATVEKSIFRHAKDAIGLKFLPVGRQRRVGVGRRGEEQMIHSNLRVEVQGSYIVVAMRGTCLRAKYRKQDAPWLAMDECAEDSEAPITFKEFRTLAWEAANEKARHLGWVKSCDELHEAVKRAGGAP
jgi:hypothetical protein